MSIRELYSFKPFVFVTREAKLTNTRSKTPQPRSGHRIVCDDGNLYSFGGYNPFISDNENDVGDPMLEVGPLFKELWKFNFASNTWLKLLCRGDMPNELASNAVLLRGKIMMIYGGTGVPFGTTCSNQLHICVLRDNYEMIPVEVKGDCPLKQYGQALVLDGYYLYTIGGTTGYEYSIDIHRLNLQTGIWEEIYICTGRGDREPEGRYRHELAFDGTIIYILGGGTAVDVYGFEKIPTFNVKTKAWEIQTTRSDSNVNPPGVPAPRRCHGCVQLPSDGPQEAAVFISGGYNGVSIFNDVWKLDLKTLQWTCVVQCTLPRAVYFHSASLTPAGQMYTFGGIAEINDDIQRTADIHSAWVCIPKLAEICWEALLHYNPKLHHNSKDWLLDVGVPGKYLSRLI